MVEIRRPGTADHRDPEPRIADACRPAFVCAFPRSCAFERPALGTPVGRDWLAEHGIADDEVSAEHVRLTRTGGSLRIEDLDSRNGTWVGGQRLDPRRPVALDDGAVVRFGSTLLVYRAELVGGLGADEPLGAMVGPFGLRAVRAALDALTRSRPRNVLIQGETGTGKEHCAHVVAAALGRATPFAAVNVSGIAAGVFESQLFGHVAGAFSDARHPSKGIVASHDGGAVFLDEVGELPAELQPKLLRLLESGEVLPVGAVKSVMVDVMFVAATNRQLVAMVEEGRFRRDLLARLAQVAIALPPLRARAEDVFAIAQRLESRRGRSLAAVDCEVEAIEQLLLQPWPANVRELSAALERFQTTDPRPGLRRWVVEDVLGIASSQSAALTSERVRTALDACAGNESEAARRLGVSRGRLRRFLDVTKDKS